MSERTQTRLLGIVIALALCVVIVEIAKSAIEPDQARARAAIVERFGPRSAAALSVAWCESRWHPGAIGNGNVGVFQVNYSAHHRRRETWRAFVARFTDLATNVAFAYRLSRGGRSWSHWTCKP